MSSDEAPRLDADRDLLAKLKLALPGLLELRDGLQDDGIYRFWYQSFKVFALQAETERIAAALQAVDPDLPLHPWFLQIVADGTGRSFEGRGALPVPDQVGARSQYEQISRQFSLMHCETIAHCGTPSTCISMHGSTPSGRHIAAQS
jgi:hypothetical protein